MAVELNARVRDASKKSVGKQLRKEGRVPAVLYGKTVGNRSVSVEEGDLMKMFHHAGRNEVIELMLDGEPSTSVMTQDIQIDPIKNHLIHVDFKEINMNEAVEVSVSLHVVGEETIEKRDGVVQLHINEITVRAMPGEIPSYIELDVSELQVGDSLKVSQLIEGQSLDYEILDQPDEVLVTINHPQLIPEEPVAEDQENQHESSENEGTEHQTEE